jgi:hypothetical protein
MLAIDLNDGHFREPFLAALASGAANIARTTPAARAVSPTQPPLDSSRFSADIVFVPMPTGSFVIEKSLNCRERGEFLCLKTRQQVQIRCRSKLREGGLDPPPCV